MATIKDVALRAGVGVGTASRVVSGTGSVAPETAERVRKAIRELDFHPSHAARSLLRGTTRMIGVYIPVLKGTFYTPILQTIDTALREEGLHMVVAFGCGDGDERQQANEGIKFLIERGCDGVMAMCNALVDEDIAAVRRKHHKLVVLNHQYADPLAEHPIPCFSADHYRGGTLAAQALLGQQHRRFAVISGPTTSPDNVARICGFMDTLADAGIARAEVLTEVSNFSAEGGWTAAHALAKSVEQFSALFCANDEMAVGALAYFQKMGIAVPDTISVLGYDDTYSAEFSAPQLSSVHIPWCEIAQSGLHWLLNRCYGTQHPVSQDFPIHITWRNSVAQPSKQAKQALTC